VLNLEVEEGYAYDYLSILEVKLHKLRTENAKKLFLNCLSNIEKQVGVDLHKKIYLSSEYIDLYDANLNTFNFVELARYHKVDAKEVDASNMQRYNCKRKLQQKFFPNKMILEEKT
jgi:hypothetical protein